MRIWLGRNDLRFSMGSRSVTEAYKAILKEVKMRSIVMKGSMGNNAAELVKLRNLSISPIPRKALTVKEVWWVPPLPGWIKGNIDGSLHENPDNIDASLSTW